MLDLGNISYAAAYQLQLAHHEEVLAARGSGIPDPGRILLLEHDPPVITISRRAGARDHLTATPDQLSRSGVEIAETDRGGDITYHGPGQLVVYPILDLNYYHLGLHAYMRLLEQAIIDTIAQWGLTGERDPSATGVWILPDSPSPNPACPPSKIAALGVRVRRWVSMHGLALNVSTNLDHFNLIVPCGLIGRDVTSMESLLASKCPPMSSVKIALTNRLTARLREAALNTHQTAEPTSAKS